MRHDRDEHEAQAAHQRPYKLILSTDQHRRLRDGHTRHYATMLEAANAFIKAREPYRQIIYDDGHEVRELDQREHALLERVCEMLGYELTETEEIDE